MIKLIQLGKTGSSSIPIKKQAIPKRRRTRHPRLACAVSDVRRRGLAWSRQREKSLARRGIRRGIHYALDLPAISPEHSTPTVSGATCRSPKSGTAWGQHRGPHCNIAMHRKCKILGSTGIAPSTSSFYRSLNVNRVSIQPPFLLFLLRMVLILIVA